MYAKYVKLRDELGLTDYKVAKSADITLSTFSDWKANRSAPKMEKLSKISKVLGVPLEFWLDEKEGK